MEFGRFQDFLSGLVARQRELFFSGDGKSSIEELLEKLMGSIGEVSGMLTARQVFDSYNEFDDAAKLAFFENLEQNYNANEVAVKLAFEMYTEATTSSNLNRLAQAAEPRRLELLRRLHQAPGATHDLVSMRRDLLTLIRDNPHLKAVDENFVRLFTSWFGRGFLVLQTIDWSTSAAILERIIRYEAVHEIKDWDDLRSRIDPVNRRCFAYFHPALTDEPLIFVEVALGHGVPDSIASILEDTPEEGGDSSKYTTATFYSISNCQPGLKNITFGNFLIKQVVQELQAEFPSIKQFVTLSPVPGFQRWLDDEAKDEPEEVIKLRDEVGALDWDVDEVEEQSATISKAVFNYLMHAKRGKYPADPVARFHLGNGATIHQINTGADLSDKGLSQSRGTMVNYLYDLASIERNHERFVTEGYVGFDGKLKSLLIKS